MAEAAKLGKTIDWEKGTELTNTEYGTIASNVLKSYGVDSSFQTKYDSPQDLANALIAAQGEPAMLNIALAGHGSTEEHSVAVQWEPDAADPSLGMFRINNIASTGGSKLVSQQDFASGKNFY